MFQERRSYAINNICTYILKCFEEHNKLADNARKAQSEARLLNNIIITIMR